MINRPADETKHHCTLRNDRISCQQPYNYNFDIILQKWKEQAYVFIIIYSLSWPEDRCKSSLFYKSSKLYIIIILCTSQALLNKQHMFRIKIKLDLFLFFS